MVKPEFGIITTIAFPTSYGSILQELKSKVFLKRFFYKIAIVLLYNSYINGANYTEEIRPSTIAPAQLNSTPCIHFRMWWKMTNMRCFGSSHVRPSFCRQIIMGIKYCWNRTRLKDMKKSDTDQLITHIRTLEAHRGIVRVSLTDSWTKTHALAQNPLLSSADQSWTLTVEPIR